MDYSIDHSFGLSTKRNDGHIRITAEEDEEYSDKVGDLTERHITNNISEMTLDLS